MWAFAKCGTAPTGRRTIRRAGTTPRPLLDGDDRAIVLGERVDANRRGENVGGHRTTIVPTFRRRSISLNVATSLLTTVVKSVAFALT